MVRKNKGKFDVYDPDCVDDPYSIGLLPHSQHWTYELPNTKRAENIFIYGTNSWGQYLLIEIKWRPKKDNRINGSVRLVFKDENGLVYELNEEDVIRIKSNQTIKEYRIAGLSVEVLSPYRKLRIKVRSYLTRKDTKQIIFTKFRFFWNSLSNVFDFENKNNYLFHKNLNSIDTEDRTEQFGQMTGTVQFEGQDIKEVFLWGNKAKQYLHKRDENLKITRVYGFDKKGFAFSIGSIDAKTQITYGYSSLTTGGVYCMTSLNLPFNQFQSISDSGIEFQYKVEYESKKYKVQIEKCSDNYGNISICNMKLNGQSGKCVILVESRDQTIDETIDEEILTEKLVPEMVLSISDPKSQNVELCGGKGSSLGSLYQLSLESHSKFVVPKGVIVTSDAYLNLIKQIHQIEDDIEHLEEIVWSKTRDGMQEKCKQLSEKFAKQKLPQDIENEIKESLVSIFGNDFESIRFAVRSSASGEDSEDMSAAGQMSTYLGVKGLDQISSAVMKCWSSQFSYVSVEYKRGYGQAINSLMAIVIQEMVNCDSAGVIFTCDPLDGDERKLIITGNYGIGESVVSAVAEPDTVRLEVNIESNSLLKRRNVKRIESIEIGSKLKKITLNENESETIETDFEKRIECCLSETESITLGEMALEVHQFYGNPRDIEWGIKDGKYYLLQSRPITNLDNSWTEWEIMHDMDTAQASESEYYTRANFGEIFPGASSHLCISWLTHIWLVGGMRGFKCVFNTRPKDFCPYYFFGLGIVCNQLFSNIKTGKPPFSVDPNSSVSKSMQMSFFGHEVNDKQLFDDSKDRELKRSFPLKYKLSAAKLFSNVLFGAKSTLKKKREILMNQDLLRNHVFNSSQELLKHILTNNELMCTAIETSFVCSMHSGVNYMVLMNLLSGNELNDENIYSDFAQLLSSAKDVISAEVPNSLREIAVSIENPIEFSSKSTEEALDYLKNSKTECSELFKKFIEKHGHRGYKEFDPLVLQWADDPIPIVKSLQTMLTNGSNSFIIKEEKSIDEIVSSIKTPLSKLKKFFLKKFLLQRTRNGVGLREQGKYLWIWTVNVYRQAFWRLSEMMVSEGRLPDRDLLFFLNVHELDLLVRERDPKLVSIAIQRKRFHDRKDKIIFSEIVIGPDMRPRNDREDILNFDVTAKITGTPVCFGQVKGRVCVAMNIEDAHNLQTGDILLTYSTDIGWSPYFPMLSGLATEIGGLISHGAVIAREYGLPCLVGVEGAHLVFKTGDYVLLDTQLGQLIKLDSL